MPEPQVSVIIPVKDDPRLSMCLEALARQDYSGGVEILVVDNGSERPLTSGEVGDGVRVLHESTPGSYAARNQGVRHATGDILAFTDSDCLPRVDWIRSGVDAVVRSDSGIAGGMVRLHAKEHAAPTLVERYELVFGLPQEHYVQRAGYAVTANLFVRRSVLGAVGPFDTRLQSGGDREWGRRAVDQGLTIGFAADAVVDHPARRTWREIRKKIKRTTAGRYELAARTWHDGNLARRLLRRSDFWLRATGKAAIVWVQQWVRYLRRTRGSSRPRLAMLALLMAISLTRWSDLIRAASRRRDRP